MRLSRQKPARPRAAMPGVGKPSWFNLLFIVPFLVCYVLLLVYPVFNGFWLSLHEIDQLSESSDFVGLANFTRLFSDAIFHGTVRNTFYFIFMTTPVFVSLGLALALALNRPGKTGATLRAIFFGSSVLSVTIVTLVWKLVLMPDRGMLANILHGIVHLVIFATFLFLTFQP